MNFYQKRMRLRAFLLNMTETPPPDNPASSPEPKTELDNLKTILSKVDGPQEASPSPAAAQPLEEMVARKQLEQALAKLQEYPGPQMSYKELKSLLEPFLGPLV